MRWAWLWIVVLATPAMAEPDRIDLDVPESLGINLAPGQNRTVTVPLVTQVACSGRASPPAVAWWWDRHSGGEGPSSWQLEPTSGLIAWEHVGSSFYVIDEDLVFNLTLLGAPQRSYPANATLHIAMSSGPGRCTENGIIMSETVGLSIQAHPPAPTGTAAVVTDGHGTLPYVTAWGLVAMTGLLWLWWVRRS